LHQRYDGQHASTAVFEREDKSFTDGNASGLTDSAFSMPNPVPTAPGLELSASELSAGVGYEILGRCSDLGNDPPKELPDLF